MSKNQLIHIPVDLVDHHVQQQEEAEYPHLFEQRKLKAMKRNGYFQLAQAEPTIDKQPAQGHTGGHNHQHHIAIPHEQQRKADQRIDDGGQKGDDPLKNKLLIGVDNRIKNMLRDQYVNFVEIENTELDEVVKQLLELINLQNKV